MKDEDLTPEARVQKALTDVSEKLDRMNWLLGAIESQNEIFMRLKAKELGVDVVWWDPSKGHPPDDGKVHNGSADIKVIYQYLPKRLRGNTGK